MLEIQHRLYHHKLFKVMQAPRQPTPEEVRIIGAKGATSSHGRNRAKQVLWLMCKYIKCSQLAGLHPMTNKIRGYLRHPLNCSIPFVGGSAGFCQVASSEIASLTRLSAPMQWGCVAARERSMQKERPQDEEPLLRLGFGRISGSLRLDNDFGRTTLACHLF